MGRLIVRLRYSRICSVTPQGVSEGESVKRTDISARTATAMGRRQGKVRVGVVGAGVFVGTTRLTQDNSNAAQATSCSPRSCLIGLPGQGCLCVNNSNIVTGASCGSVAGGVAFGGSCSVPDRPCASGLSCNNAICQDRSGDCPF